MPVPLDGPIVDDPTDPGLAVFMGLRDQELRQRREAAGGDLEGVFIAEGDVVIQRAIDAGHRLISVFAEASRTRPLEFDVGDAAVYRGGVPVVEAIASNRRYRGCMACFQRPPDIPLSELLGDSRTIIVTEHVNNPTNLGVIMRTAAALGIDALLADPQSCDPLARRACRVSMGTVFAIRHGRCGPLPGALDELAEFETIALTPADDATPLDELPPLGDRVALLLGAEEPGLTAHTMAAATHRARIPMHSGVDSLNVATAAAIAMWQLTRAR